MRWTLLCSKKVWEKSLSSLPSAQGSDTDQDLDGPSGDFGGNLQCLEERGFLRSQTSVDRVHKYINGCYSTSLGRGSYLKGKILYVIISSPLLNAQTTKVTICIRRKAALGNGTVPQKKIRS